MKGLVLSALILLSLPVFARTIVGRIVKHSGDIFLIEGEDDLDSYLSKDVYRLEPTDPSYRIVVAVLENAKEGALYRAEGEDAGHVYSTELAKTVMKFSVDKMTKHDPSTAYVECNIDLTKKVAYLFGAPETRPLSAPQNPAELGVQ